MSFEINIPDGAKKIINTLENQGRSAYVVGGCVRDSILGRKPNDWDICTSAKPNEMLEIFRAKRVIETGLQHGTVTVVADDEAYEVTTYRIDGDYSDNRRPDYVTFTDNIVEDLRRRDFTVNAMAYNPHQGLIDPFGGRDDIKSEIIRCVGSAKERFGEDALRILRAIRFSAKLGFGVESETDRQIHMMFRNLEDISVERINSELCGMVLSDGFGDVLVRYCDVFSFFIPELKEMIDFPQNNPWHIYDVFGHTIHAVESCEEKDLIIRLAAFFHDFGKPRSCCDGDDGIRHFYGHAKLSAEMTESIMKRLKFDNDARCKVAELVRYHDVLIEPDRKYVKKWLNRLGEEQFRRLMKVKEADNKAQNLDLTGERIVEIHKIETVVDEVLQSEECFSLKNLAVSGTDLIGIGYEPGKELGETLKYLLDCVIDEKTENNKEQLLLLAKKLQCDHCDEK